jgi:hypothetical protein
LVGLEKVREGGRHEVWKTSKGEIVEIPRHRRNLVAVYFTRSCAKLV